MSNRDVQEMRFACPSCGEGIDVTLKLNSGWTLKGVEMVDFEGPFTNEYPFLDLHLDFPVRSGEYVMGQTPFMVASMMIGHENYHMHNGRLDALNEIYIKNVEYKRIIRLFGKNVDLFGRLCKANFGEELNSKSPQDVNLVLYSVLAKMFFPFSMPEDSSRSTQAHYEAIVEAERVSKNGFSGFIKDITDTKFLFNIQNDCLQIYSRVLEGEVAFRPALFLDFYSSKGNENIAFRVSSKDFYEFKDLYKDISEIINRQLILVAGLNNVLKRGDHNSFNSSKKNYPKNLNKFADMAYGMKAGHLDDCWYDLLDGAIDNQLRNSIAHVKAGYDDVSQIITYFPRKEGIKQEKPEVMSLLEFLRATLISYREMHSLNHLIKCLLFSYYLHYKKSA